MIFWLFLFYNDEKAEMINKTIVLAGLAFIHFTAAAQECKPFLGSKTLYKPQQQKYSPAPPDYLPVFINHVGRHGARHVTKDVNSSYLYQLLLQADSLGGLLADGRLLKEKVLRLEKLEKKNFKSISMQGEKEQQGLAARMHANYSNVFNRAQTKIDIAYTKEIRTLQTSDAFLSGLAKKVTNPLVFRHPNDTTLRFYDLSPAYLAFKETGGWVPYMQRLKTAVKYNELAGNITRQFFTSSFLKNITVPEREKFTADLFGFICIYYSLKSEVSTAGYNAGDVSMRSFLTCSQLSILEEIDNAEDFFEKGPGIAVDGIQVKIAVPLLADFIRTTDAFIRSEPVDLQLRFAHAETISPYAALLGLTHAAQPTKNVKDIQRVWNAAEIIPLSSNIQWILYKNKNGKDYLIKFLLNEKEAAVRGLTTKTFPYYNWTEVRAFYLKKLQGFNATPETDYIKYLEETK